MKLNATAKTYSKPTTHNPHCHPTLSYNNNSFIMPSKGRKRKSAPGELERSTPHADGDFVPPPSKQARRSSVKTRSVTESQDTLTQMHFVTPLSLSFDGQFSDEDGQMPVRSLGRKRRTGVEESEERQGAPRKKRNSGRSVKFEVEDREDKHEPYLASKSRKRGRLSSVEMKRQETLTQMDFGKFLGRVVMDSDDEPEDGLMLLPEELTDAVKPQGELEPAPCDPANECREPSLEITGPSNPTNIGPVPSMTTIIRTPKKFRGKDVVLSSQSPANSAISTQSPLKEQSPLANQSAFSNKLTNSAAKLRSAASPLKERSSNVRRLSISPTKFHVRQFNARLAEAEKENAQRQTPVSLLEKFVRSSTETIESIVLVGNQQNIPPRTTDSEVKAEKLTQPTPHSIDLTCKGSYENNVVGISSEGDEGEAEEIITESPVKLTVADEPTDENQTISRQPQAGVPTSQYPDARFFWQHEPSWRPESTNTYLEPIKERNTQDSASAQLRRETQAYIERIHSSQNEEPDRVPSSQETPIALPSSHPTQFQHPSSTRIRQSQISTLGSALAPTPHHSQRLVHSPPSKRSVIAIPSSPSRASVVVIPSSPSVQRMGPPPIPDSTQVTPRTKRVQNLRKQLLEFDYEDDPAGMTGSLQDSCLDESVGLPPAVSSPVESLK